MNITDLSAAQLRRAAEIKERLEAAHAELNSLLGGGYVGNGFLADGPLKPTVKKLHWTQTPEGKARLARSMRRAWLRRRMA